MIKSRVQVLVGVAGATAVAALAASCSPTPSEPVVYHPNYPTFASVAGLEEAADLVVVGTPISSDVRKVDLAADPSSTGNDPELDPSSGEVEGEQASSIFTYTVYQVHVEQVMAGDTSPGETIEVGFLGGTIDGVEYRDGEGGHQLNLDEPVALYLATFENEVPAQPLNNTQAVYVESEGAFESLDSENTIGAEVAETLNAAIQ